MRLCARCRKVLPDTLRQNAKYCSPQCRRAVAREAWVSRDPEHAREVARAYERRRASTRHSVAEESLERTRFPAMVGLQTTSAAESPAEARRRKLHRRWIRRGYCRKNLHRMTPENTGYRGDRDTYFCLACRRAQQVRNRRERKALGYQFVKCSIKGCTDGIDRPPQRVSEPYLCPRHRAPKRWTVAA